MKKKLEEFSSYLANNFYLDIRSMALFRILIGIILILDLMFRFSIVEDFYISSGILPHVLDTLNIHNFSIYHFIDSAFLIKSLIVVQIIVASFLVLGFKTRLSAFLSYLLLMFLQRKNIEILNSGDTLLTCLLFYLVLLPTHLSYSIDSSMNENQEENKFFDITALLTFLQILIIYLTTAAFKDSREWYIEFTAIEVALNLDQFVTSIGRVLKNFPEILKILTIGSIVLEGIFPVLFLIPRIKSHFRDLLVTSFILFHVGIELTLGIGHFSYISIAMWTLLYTNTFWDKVAIYFKAKEHQKYKLYYDADCGFCYKICRIIKMFLRLKSLEILPSTRSRIVFEKMNNNKSWILEYNNEYFIDFIVWNKLLALSPFSFLSFIFNNRIALLIGKKLYYLISSKRRYLSYLTKTINQNEIKNHRFVQIIAGYLIFHLFISSIYPLLYKNYYPNLPKNGLETIYEINRSFNLKQEWKMFSPAPSNEDYWFVIEVIEDGKVVDNLLGTSVRKPESFKDLFPNRAWRKYSRKIYNSKKKASWYLDYICRKRNLANKTLRLTRYKEKYIDGHEKISGNIHIEKKCPVL